MALNEVNINHRYENPQPDDGTHPTIGYTQASDWNDEENVSGSTGEPTEAALMTFDALSSTCGAWRNLNVGSGLSVSHTDTALTIEVDGSAVTGSGTPDYLTKWGIYGNTLEDTSVYEDMYGLTIDEDAHITGDLDIDGTITGGTWNGSTIGVIYGGTGFASYTTGNLLYANSSTTLAKLAVGASAGMFLRSTGTVPAWSTLILPDSATANRVVYATGTNTWGESGNLTFSGSVLAVTGSLTLSTPLAAAQGGTGIASYAVGDLLYASASTTLSKLADVAAGSYLRSGGVTTAPVWSTLILPNSATANRIPYATSTNTWGDSANLTFDGTSFAIGTAGPHAIGGAINAGIAVYHRGTFTSTQAFSRGFQIDQTLVAGAASGNLVGIYVNPVLQEYSSGTHPILAGIYVEPSVTAGTADVTLGAGVYVAQITFQTTTTTGASLYIANATAGAGTNYAMFVDAGLSRFDGNGTHVFELPADTTAAGAYKGRIPVSIGGSTQYLHYYDA